MSELPEGTELIGVLRLQPGDVLVIRAKDMLSAEQAERIKKTFQALTEKFQIKVAVLDGGLTLDVLRKSESEAA